MLSPSTLHALALGTCQPCPLWVGVALKVGKPWLNPVGPPQVSEVKEQEQQTEVPEPTPTPEGTSQDVTTVTLLLRAPPGGTPSSSASPNSSPTTASPEPPLEPAGTQCPAVEAPDSPEPPPSSSGAPRPDSPESPATLSTEGQVVNKVSLE